MCSRAQNWIGWPKALQMHSVAGWSICDTKGTILILEFFDDFFATNITNFVIFFDFFFKKFKTGQNGNF